MNSSRRWQKEKYAGRWMSLIRQALSKIGEILILYLKLLLLAIVLYAMVYGYLRYFEATSLTDVGNSSLGSHPASRSDL